MLALVIFFGLDALEARLRVNRTLCGVDGVNFSQPWEWNDCIVFATPIFIRVVDYSCSCPMPSLRFNVTGAERRKFLETKNKATWFTADLPSEGMGLECNGILPQFFESGCEISVWMASALIAPTLS